MAASSLSASGVRWNLDDLAPSADAARGAWDELLARARDYAERRRGTVASVGPAELFALLSELDALYEDIARARFYATAREHTEATDAEANDLATLARDRMADLESLLLFVDLEWLALDDAAADALLAAPELEPYAHRLQGRARGEAVRPAAKARSRRSTRAARRSRRGSRSTAASSRRSTVDFDGGEGPEPHTLDRLLAYVHHPDREIRLAALDTVYGALAGSCRRAGGLLRRDRRRPAFGGQAARRGPSRCCRRTRRTSSRARSSRR